jgi:hypothetical protein
MNLTKGGMSPAKIVNLSTQEEVLFMFNPYEYTLAKQNTWETEWGKGQNVPHHNFQRGGSQSLSLALHFDSLLEKKDVRGYTDMLWKMMMIDEQEIDAKTGKGSPPPIAFEWGKLYFKAIITSMNQKFSLFLADGTPVRCTVDVKLEQYVDENKFQPQIQGMGQGQDPPPTTTVVEGDRLDHVSNNPRSVANNNNIDDPLNVPPGTTLST